METETDAWKAIKVEIHERNFAKEHDLLPTDDEILACSQTMRQVAESTEESHAILRSLVSAMGMTEDEYWNEYQPVYEAPLLLIYSNTAQYRSENGLEAVDPDEIEGEIIDQDYFDSL